MDDGELARLCLEITDACACEGLRRTSRAVTAVYQHALAGTGVRAAQLPILVAAQLMGPAPLGAMADVLVVDRTTLTRNLATLTAEGLVAVADADHEAAADDGRVRLVTITQQGRAALEEAVGAGRQAQRRVASAFGPARLEALVSELRAFAEATRA